MSASFGVLHAPPQEAFGPQVFGHPPGLAYPPGLQSNMANDGESSLFVSGMVACVRCTERNALICLTSYVTRTTRVHDLFSLFPVIPTLPHVIQLLALTSLARSGVLQ
jgi:hypothetical protein